MDLFSVMLAIYTCPQLIQRITGEACLLSDRVEFLAHSLLAVMVFLIFSITLLILRHKRQQRDAEYE